MENIFQKYKALSNKQQWGIIIAVFITALFLLPNTLVYAVSTVLAYKLIEKKALRYTAVSVFSVITLFSAVLLLPESAPISQPQNNAIADQVVQSTDTQTDQVNVSSTTDQSAISIQDNVTASDGSVTQPSPVSPIETAPAQTNSGNTISYKVVEVVDGDTVKIDMNGTTETIRLIGIDTPETVHPSKPVECFGIEASNKAKELLSGKTVSLETDISQGERDKYGRLLGYIILADGTNFNLQMIKQGYAYEYTYSSAYKYQSSFKSAQQYAKENGIGLWGAGVCADKTETNTPVITPATTSGDKWYVSSHYSSKYYYCEASDGWKTLSPSYLKTYNSEAELLADYPNHTLHESCN